MSTSTFKDALPPELVTHVTAICGARGEEWFDRLPEMIITLESRWSVTVKEPFPGIEFNFVAEAQFADGEPAVVKIAPPFERTEIFGEAKYLRVREGAGAVRLLAGDREMKAILIERALPGEALFQYHANDPLASVAPAIGVLRAILRPPPSDTADVDTLDAWFERFRRYRETDFPHDLAEKAIEIYERRSKGRDRIFCLHGDFHPGNIVTSVRAPFLAIDPKGIVGHVGYDIAVFLNNLHWWQKEDPEVKQLLSNAIEQFANAFAFDIHELHEWAFASMVIGAWWSFEDMPELYDGEVALSDIWNV